MGTCAQLIHVQQSYTAHIYSVLTCITILYSIYKYTFTHIHVHVYTHTWCKNFQCYPLEIDSVGQLEEPARTENEQYTYTSVEIL